MKDETAKSEVAGPEDRHEDGDRSRRMSITPSKVERDTEFELFYLRELPRLVAFLATHGARVSMATDVAQETMMQAYRRWDDLEKPRAWIRTVASRTWWRQEQQQRQEIPHDQCPDSHTLLDVDAATEIESRHEVLSILKTLPIQQRQVMAWFYDGYQPNEIAAVLGKPVTTVRSLLRHARAALQKHHETGE
ncbi:sigma-70 family RNA polymerase sigma factor [Actinoplanes sp. TBRC 11911]|uniref:RNA polymerase sigma factor n=1 Tax=Actinoplanes sp. TBRC 11911 TaxID=2729386 RepID=UPI00145D683A|nr:sigma-70 family RNA polymerase sigma factor [Actinoplanes sp. TBRC 11911]NMO53422.1 sigma-70 family RNA polymerase sigma factor [Actinoplanes sp. TBRC 11911]